MNFSPSNECRICRYWIPEGELCDRCRSEILQGLLKHPDEIEQARIMAERVRQLEIAE